MYAVKSLRRMGDGISAAYTTADNMLELRWGNKHQGEATPLKCYLAVHTILAQTEQGGRGH